MKNNFEPKVPIMLTIKELAKRTHMSEYFIRKSCWNNQIAYVKSGSKYLINYERFIDYLNGQEIKAV